MLRHWRPGSVLAATCDVRAGGATKYHARHRGGAGAWSWQLEGLEELASPYTLPPSPTYRPTTWTATGTWSDYGAAKKLIFSHQRAERRLGGAQRQPTPSSSGWAGEAPASGLVRGGWHARTRWLSCLMGCGWWRSGGKTKLCANDEIAVPGTHNRANAACASMLAMLAGAPLDAVRAGLRSFQGVADRLEYLASLDGVAFYNDTTSTTPASTVAALHALDAPVVLIAGGADKGLDFAELAGVVAERTRAVALLEGTATGLMERQFRGGHDYPWATRRLRRGGGVGVAGCSPGRSRAPLPRYRVLRHVQQRVPSWRALPRYRGRPCGKPLPSVPPECRLRLIRL